MAKSDFLKRFKARPASHSFFSSWEYDKEEWYKSYILNDRSAPNQAMVFCNTVGDTLGLPESMVPDLDLPGIKEYELEAKFDGIRLVGYCDHYDPDNKILNENKTSVTRDRWTQKMVDEHPQLTMYCFMLYLTYKVKPEDVTIYLNFIKVKKAGLKLKLHNPPQYVRFKTKRTMRDVLMHGAYSQKTLKEMEEYVKTCQNI